ncbi:MAG: hypothetical protein NTU65_11760 [Cyanobacteria bacterium]|nr:hypothetical protein [Cyanobacteriota bacterium]
METQAGNYHPATTRPGFSWTSAPIRSDPVNAQIRDDLRLELGDVLWYLAQLASELDLDLEDIAAANLAKLASRMDRNVIGGSGDRR